MNSAQWHNAAMYKLTGSAILAVLLSGCAIHIKDSSFMRPVAAGEIAFTSAELPTDYSLVTDRIWTPDGKQLYRAKFSHAKAKSTVLFFGGNASTLEKSAMAIATELTRDWHPNIVFADYRGYGQSTGTPSLQALRSDALQLYDIEAEIAKENGLKLIVAGFSIGGVVAGALLEERQPDGAILMATVTNVSEMREMAFSWYTKPFVRVTIDPALLGVDNLRAVKGFKGPLLVAGAEKDSQTPVIFSKRLFDAALSPKPLKRLVVVPRVDHNELLRTSEFHVALRQFAIDHGF
ncbi:alpha/beta hydrolase [Limnohabitans sp. Rim8]|uniref:alpha/beta hydrolase n=1 Tax=Limnohabitans sp. Rim8 TaxID=1100718 RepID=UPI0033061B6B